MANVTDSAKGSGWDSFLQLDVFEVFKGNIKRGSNRATSFNVKAIFDPSNIFLVGGTYLFFVKNGEIRVCSGSIAVGSSIFRQRISQVKNLRKRKRDVFVR